MEIAPHVFKFDTGPFNWYLIEEGGRLTLVDAGFPGHFRVFEQGLQSLGKSLKDVEAIVLTHAHADHIGFAEKVRRLTNAPVFVHAADARMACRPLQLPWGGLLANAWRPYTATMLGVAVLNGVFALPHLTTVQPLRDGQRLDVPGRPRVLHTPGHTAGEVVLLLEERGVLLSGDTLVTRNLLTGAQGPPQLTSPVLNGDFRQAARSLDLLRELGQQTLLAGHGPAWTGDMHEAVALALETART